MNGAARARDGNRSRTASMGNGARLSRADKVEAPWASQDRASCDRASEGGAAGGMALYPIDCNGAPFHIVPRARTGRPYRATPTTLTPSCRRFYLYVWRLQYN